MSDFRSDPSKEQTSVRTTLPRSLTYFLPLISILRLLSAIQANCEPTSFPENAIRLRVEPNGSVVLQGIETKKLAHDLRDTTQKRPETDRCLLIDFRQADADSSRLADLLDIAGKAGIKDVGLLIGNEAPDMSLQGRERPTHTDAKLERPELRLKADGHAFFEQQWWPRNNLASLLLNTYRESPGANFVLAFEPTNSTIFTFYGDAARTLEMAMQAGFEHAMLKWLRGPSDGDGGHQIDRAFRVALIKRFEN